MSSMPLRSASWVAASLPAGFGLRVVLGLLLLSGGVYAGTPAFLDFGEATPDAIALHTAEKRGQSARSETVDNRKALRIDWDCAKSAYFEFALRKQAPLPEFLSARVRVQAYLPENVPARKLNFRLVDRDGETFQFEGVVTPGAAGWREFVYELDAQKPKAGSWGKKANKTIEFPAKFSGMAADFNAKEGMGYLALGRVDFEVIRAGRSTTALQPRLETGSPVGVTTPDAPRPPEVVLANTKGYAVEGDLRFTVADPYGVEVESRSARLRLAPGERAALPLRSPGRFGVYYVTVRFAEDDPKVEPYKKEFRFSHMVPAGPTPGMAEGFLFGVCSHPQSLSEADQAREALAAALCGIKVMRTDMRWEYMQPTADGPWRFDRYDRVVDTFGKQNIEVQAIYSYLPAWAAVKGHKPLNPGIKGKPRPDYDAWRTFIRTTAERYRGKIRFMEVWNEPDHLGFANFPASEYVEMMKIAYAETKKADPGMTVLTGGFTCMPSDFARLNPDHMVTTLRDGKGFYDIIAFHGHGAYASYRSQIEKLVAMCRAMGIDRPWYANETAISAIHIGELNQAATLFRKFLYSWARGAMGYNWYDLRNDGYDPKNNEHNFGLVTKDFQPKAAYGVYNMLATLFARGEYLEDRDPGSGATGFFFRDARGELLYPHWGDADDRLVLLSGIAGTVERVDLFGNAEPLAVDNGSLMLKIGRLPATLRFAGQKALPTVHGDFFRADNDFVFRSGRRSDYRLTLTNPAARPLDYRLDYTLPEGLRLHKAPTTARVAPGEKATVTLDIEADAGFRSFRGRQQYLEIALETDGGWRGALRFPVHSATVLEKRLRDQPDFTLDRPEQVTVLVPNHPDNVPLFWQGPEDLSAKVFLGHDDRHLLVRVEARDDRHHQPYTGENAWRGDNVQLAMKLPRQNNLWEIGLTRRDDGESEVFLWLAPDGFDPAAVARSVELATERDEAARTTVYSARIPFDAIGLTEAGRRQGFRFNLLVNDNDGPMRESFIGIAPGIGENKTPDSYPFVVFEP